MWGVMPEFRSAFSIRWYRAVCSLAVLAAVLLPVGAQEPAPLQRFSADIDGHTFAVWARVPASPRGAVLLLHGRTWSSRPDFDLQVPGLRRSVLASLAARGFAAYAMDQRGYGDTSRDRTGWITPRRAARDAAGILEWVASRHPGLPRPVLVGWSLGAATAHLVAATTPARLSKLVLFGYAPDPDGVIAPIKEPTRPPRLRNTKEAAESDFISPQVTDPAVVKAFVETALRTDPVHVDWKDEEQFLCDSSMIRVPTMLIFGELDPNVETTDVLPRFFDRLGTREKLIVSLPGADHCAQLEDTHDAWISAVVDFAVGSGRRSAGRVESGRKDLSEEWLY
jgi:pimeloyl-ACP methyl ester carboxylesterase